LCGGGKSVGKGAWERSDKMFELFYKKTSKKRRGAIGVQTSRRRGGKVPK